MSTVSVDRDVGFIRGAVLEMGLVFVACSMWTPFFIFRSLCFCGYPGFVFHIMRGLGAPFMTTSSISPCSPISPPSR